jgi:ABC-type nitrate/sulfonate/bicarbonate transport system permease component
MNRLTTTLRTLWPPVVVFALILLGWQLLVSAKNLQSFVVPAPVDVWHALTGDFSFLLDAASYTAGEMALGFLFGAGIGFLLAVLMAYSRLAQRALYPVLITTQTIPPIVIAPPLVIAIGYSIWPKVIVTALIVFFPVLVNAYQGLTTVDRELLLLMRSMRASAWQTFRLVRLPAAAPLMFAAMKLAATYSVIGAVFGEWVGSDKGIGVYILQANSRLQTDRVYAAIVVLAVIGILAVLAVAIWEYLATPWRRRSTRHRSLGRTAVPVTTPEEIAP